MTGDVPRPESGVSNEGDASRPPESLKPDQGRLFDTAEFRPDPTATEPAQPFDSDDDPDETADDSDDSDGTGFFGSPSMRRLFAAQVVSSLGDWIGVVALLAVADRLVQGTAFDTFGTSFVLMSRLVPGLFLAPAAGVIVDRFDRRRLMVWCDIMRGCLMLTLPFVSQLWLLVIVSLLLEAGQLLWVPAKEASIPNLVKGRYVGRANSMSLAAAYGTFPIGAAMFAGLARVAALIGGISFLSRFEVDQESLALFLDAGTFFLSGWLVYGLVLPQGPSNAREKAPGLHDEWEDLKVGIRFIRSNKLVRTVMAGLGAALLGAGAVVSLGPTFVRELLAGGAAGFGIILFSLGLGAAAGVLLVNLVGRRIPPVFMFCGSLALAGASLVVAASMSSLPPGAFFVFLVGLFGAPGYSGGFTVMHQHVDDQLRGRVFGALLTVIRICMVISLAFAPIFAALLNRVLGLIFTDNIVDFGAFSLNVAGTRVTLWIAGVLIGGAGLWAARRLIGKRELFRRRPVAELPRGVEPDDVAPFDG